MSFAKERRRLFNPHARAACGARMRERRDILRRLSHPWSSALLRLNVAAEFAVDVELMTGPRKFPELVEARCACALVMRRRFGWSTTRIGRALGDRDHTTIGHALREGARRESADPDFAARLARIEAEMWPVEREEQPCAA